MSPGETIETLDPLAAQAVAAQIAVGELLAPGVRPGRIDHDIDTKPRIPRPRVEQPTDSTEETKR